MTKHTFTLVVVLTSLILFRCSDEAHEKQPIELSQEEISKVILQAVVEEQKKQDQIVLAHYNALENSVKEKLTFREFNLDLTLKYKRFTDRALKEFQQMDIESDPDSQLERLRDSIRHEEKIPHWYWQLRENSNEKIREVAFEHM